METVQIAREDVLVFSDDEQPTTISGLVGDD